MSGERPLTYRIRCTECDWAPEEITDPTLFDWGKTLAHKHASAHRHVVHIFIKREVTSK